MAQWRIALTPHASRADPSHVACVRVNPPSSFCGAAMTTSVNCVTCSSVSDESGYAWRSSGYQAIWSIDTPCIRCTRTYRSALGTVVFHGLPRPPTSSRALGTSVWTQAVEEQLRSPSREIQQHHQSHVVEIACSSTRQPLVRDSLRTSQHKVLLQSVLLPDDGSETQQRSPRETESSVSRQGTGMVHTADKAPGA